MEYRDNYSQVDQAMEGDNTHGSYKVSQHSSSLKGYLPLSIAQVTLPDGRMQSVEYSSAGGGGYKARVEYRDKHSHYSRS